MGHNICFVCPQNILSQKKIRRSAIIEECELSRVASSLGENGLCFFDMLLRLAYHYNHLPWMGTILDNMCTVDGIYMHTHQRR